MAGTLRDVIRIPLHLHPDDHSPEIDGIRVALHMKLVELSKGRGFRKAAGTSPKRLKPRRGWLQHPRVDRLVTLSINAKYGERT